MINALSDNCVPVVEENMHKRINTASNTGLVNITSAQCYVDYCNFAIKANQLITSKDYRSLEFEEILITTRDIDFVKLVTEKSEYTKTLTEDQNVKAAAFVNFIKDKFAINV